MNRAFLLTGGNLGDRYENLQKALRLIKKNIGDITLQSSIYETAAWGKTDQPSFFNQVLHIQTQLPANDLLIELLKIENELGRIRDMRMGPRTIDLDILFYNDEIIETEGLVIPHPQIAYRRFVLTPMAEIAPFYIHPKLGIPVIELLENCSDKLPVQKIEKPHG